jgi:hypothetical protein
MVPMLRSLPRRAFRYVFEPAARYPADPRAVFILALSVFSGIVTMALESGPGTLESLLPKWGVLVWGAILTVGSLVTLVGLARQTNDGIIAEQVGSVMVGVACIFYSILAIMVVGIGSSQPVVIILAWGLSCLVRWLQLQSLVKKMIHEKELRDAEMAVRQAINLDREEES